MEVYDYDRAPPSLKKLFKEFDYVVICKDMYDCYGDFFMGVGQISETFRYKIVEEGIKEYCGVLGGKINFKMYDDWVLVSKKTCKDYLGFEIILFNIVIDPNIIFMEEDKGFDSEEDY